MTRGTFHGIPTFLKYPGHGKYILEQKPERWFGYLDSTGIWWIPRDGLHTDQGSIPLFGQIISRVQDDQCWAFLLHDNGYEFHSRDVYATGPKGLPDLSQVVDIVMVKRDDVDYYCLGEAMYTEQLDNNIVNTFQRFLVYRSVRIFQSCREFAVGARCGDYFRKTGLDMEWPKIVR